MTLKTKEFIRRFCLHILPIGFTRIRHYGILSSAWEKEKFPKLQEELGIKKEKNEVETTEISYARRCPKCKVGKLETIIKFDNKGPPSNYIELVEHLLSRVNKSE